MTSTEWFSNSQLYVAHARSSSLDNVRVAAIEGHRERIEHDRVYDVTVYREVL
jgi:hypothetical protein